MSTTTVITVYDRPADATAPADLGAGHRLHRAVGQPASFGWVDLMEAPDEAAAEIAVRAATGDPDALTGRYQAFHIGETAAPSYAAAPGEPVLFVNCFRFPPDRHDAAVAIWRRVNAYMVLKPGYRGHRLHRRLDADAPFGLVNVVQWESTEAWRAAHDEGFRALASGDLPFTSHPTLCSLVSAPVAQP